MRGTMPAAVAPKLRHGRETISRCGTSLARHVHMKPRRLRALVADDDREILRIVAQTLEQFGADVTCATTGGELLQALSEAQVDVVIADVAMPWMTGLQVMHSARTAGLMTPVVVMTALRDSKVADTAAALGQHAAFLQKPFGIEDLYAALRSVLGDRIDIADLALKASSCP
jgi:CheY-like chemotaxis protein